MDMKHLMPMLLLVACSSPRPLTPTPPAGDADAIALLDHPLAPLRSALPSRPRLHGVWQSVGYGWAAVLRPDAIRLFDLSRAGCVELPESETEELELFAYGGLLGQELVVSELPLSTRYRFQRLEELPSSCKETLADSAPSVIDYLWRVMDELYPFFALHQVDWQERGQRARARVSDATSDEELAQIIESMLQGIDDGHLVVEAKLDGKPKRIQPSSSRVLDKEFVRQFAEQNEHPTPKAFRMAWRDRYKYNVTQRILGGKHSRKPGPMVWGRLASNPKIGYVNIVGVAGFAEGGTMKEEIAAVHAKMNEMLRSMEGTDALIVDLSVNSGGYDDVSRAIAGHFTHKRVKAYSKYAFGFATKTWHEFYVEPARGQRYSGPVVMVTSDKTISGGEILVMCMRAISSVEHVGMTTRGALSDVLPKRLPNGWHLLMSGEIYADHQGRKWEGKGIPPARSIAVFDPENLFDSHAEAIEAIAAKLGR